MKYLLILCLALAGCAELTPEQKGRAAQTGSYVAQRALEIAVNTVVSAAVSPRDADHKGNYLDGLASAFRTQPLVNANDVRHLVNLWTPGDKQHWSNLAGEIARLFESTRNVPEAQRVELIAQGLNAAAAKARAL